MKFPSYSEKAAQKSMSSLPRLSMDEYIEFLSESMPFIHPEQVARQKALEKQIKKPFRIIE